MAGNNVYIEITAAKERATEIEDYSAKIQTALDTLTSEMRNNINKEGIWSGAGAASFLATFEKCEENFEDFQNHLKTIKTQMDATNEAMQQLNQVGN